MQHERVHVWPKLCDQEGHLVRPLWRVDDHMYGTVTVPSALSGGKLPTNLTTDKMPIKDAFRGAIQLANEIKAPVVVIDPDSLWQAEWGDLYRPERAPEWERHNSAKCDRHHGGQHRQGYCHHVPLAPGASCLSVCSGFNLVLACCRMGGSRA